MTKYSYKEAFDASVSYFGGDELAAKVFVDKYALRKRDDNSLLEKTPDDMHWRIANEIARIERKKGFTKPYLPSEVFDFLKGFHRMIPQGSPMYGIGNKEQYVTLSNCYVIDSPEDSYGGIHNTDEQISQISKRRGGTGLDISHLRPDGSATQNSSRNSTGIIPFMERFSNSIREVGQDGRRGALMITISVHHPQVLDFANVKKDLTKVTGANISVRLSDEFLNAVMKDELYEQRWPIEGTPVISRMVRAKDVWDEIIKNAHGMAEPGLLFWDNIIRNSPADCYSSFGFKTVSTNPCSELPLSVLDSCRLLLLNLFTYVNNPFKEDAYFDYARFYQDAQIAQRLMDDIVDLEIEAVERIIDKLESDPEPYHIKSREINLWTRVRQNCINGRRTGTGTTALGDTIAALGLKYGSDESLKVSEKIYQVLKFGCYKSSIDMAEELGPFPIFNGKLESECLFFQRFKNEYVELNDGLILSGKDLIISMNKVGRRNIALLTSAPAGSASIEAQTSSGIEPVYSLIMYRSKKGNPGDEHFRVDRTDANGDSWMEFKVYHPKLKMWMDITGETDEEKSPYFGSCADDLDWKKRVELQATINRHVDHAISSTINLPSDVGVDKVAEIYETAWKLGCKGITVYRDGCRAGVLNKEATKKKEDGRPRSLPCDIHHITVQGKQYFVLVGLDEDDKPYEVFAGKNGVLDKAIKRGAILRKKKGFYQLVSEDDAKDILLAPVTATCDEHEEIITRLTSLNLRGGTDIHLIVQQLEKVDGQLNGFAKSVARTLKRYIKEGTIEHGESCPSCGGANIIRQEGCITCKDCGWSKC